MIALTYNVDYDKKESELEWLNDRKVYPSIREVWNWGSQKKLIKIGAIVSEDIAITIKLRHNLTHQRLYI